MTNNTIISEVPLLDLNAQYTQIKAEVRHAIDEVLQSQYFVMGPEVSSFEEKVADYCNTSYSISCASGSDALLLSLMALNVGPGDAIITSPYTFFATGGAIARLGAIPVFLDINPKSYNLDPSQVKDFLGGVHPLNKKLGINAKEVKAIIPVHLYGQMADMDPLMALAREYDLAVIEDAAQSIGAEYKHRRAGSIGDFGCFSFFPSKNLGGYGDGGLVTTNNAEMAKKLSILRLHGAKPKYHHSIVGINSRLDAIQAAILKVKLQYLDEWSDARREKAMTYNKLFKEADLTMESAVLDQLDSNGELQRPEYKIILPEELHGNPENGGRHIYHQYVVQTGHRKKIMDALDEHNIGHSIYYPVPLHEQECFSYLGYEAEDCPISHLASNETLALPIFPEITDEQQRFVVETINNVIKSI